MTDKEQKQIFVKRMKEQMAKSGVNQKALSEKCGIKESSFSYYLNEKENRMPKGSDLANIANELHTTTDYLLGVERQGIGFAEIKTLLADSTMDMTQDEIKELSRMLLFAYQRQEGVN